MGSVPKDLQSLILFISDCSSPALTIDVLNLNYRSVLFLRKPSEESNYCKKNWAKVYSEQLKHLFNELAGLDEKSGIGLSGKQEQE